MTEIRPPNDRLPQPTSGNNKDVPGNLLSHEIIGERIRLRQFTLDDAPDIFALIDGSREHLSQHGEPTSDRYQTIDNVIESIKNPTKNRTRFGIWNEQTELVGSINLQVDEHNPKRAELGYYLGSKHLHHGYTTEAVNLLTPAIFTQTNIETIFADIRSDNHPSLLVMVRAGYKSQGEFMKNGHSHIRYVQNKVAK